MYSQYLLPLLNCLTSLFNYLYQTSSGRPRKISGQAYQELQKRLATRTGFGSYGEIQSWLAKQHQLETAYSTVHGTVRYRIGAKIKASRPRSREADPEVQTNFKKNCQPLLR